MYPFVCVFSGWKDNLEHMLLGCSVMVELGLNPIFFQQKYMLLHILIHFWGPTHN